MRRYTSPASITSKDEVTYDLMSEEDAFREMSKIVRNISEVLGLSSTTIVRLLLNHFRWDQNVLTERFWDDPDRLFQQCKIPNPTSSPSADYNPLSPQPTDVQKSSTKTKGPQLVTCRTCYADKPPHEFYSLPCGHQHCLTCWQLYLESSINQNSTGHRISCPSRCNQIIDDEQIGRFLSTNPRLKQRYEHSLVNTYVESNPLAHWCPGKSCNTIVKLRSSVSDYAYKISCDTCTSIFCFHCLKQWHDPIQCSLLVKWEKKNRDESMTGEWLLANTKDCPKCQSSIEKNGGCNHMTCRKPGCSNEFCWLCLGSWQSHAAQQCNVFREGETTQNQAKARETLDRYMHYFTRYAVHQQSLDLEDKLSAAEAERKQQMQVDGRTFTEQKAFDKAMDVLKQCRYTLKYTYAFAFYLYRNNQAEVFEQNQADLERATEALSGFLEQEVDPDKSISLQLMDKATYCTQRRQTLLDHCKEGYQEHYWGGLDTY